MRPIKYDAIKNDMRLMEMALYEGTKGQTSKSTQAAITQKILEYKGLIKRGSYTIDQLEDKIFSQYGILNNRSQTDTVVYDANLETESDPLANLFGGLFRKHKGLDSKLPQLPDSPDSPDSPHPDSVHNLIDEESFRELNDQLNHDQVDRDFPETPEPPAPDDFDEYEEPYNPLDSDVNLPF